jgi:hypothetical protein
MKTPVLLGALVLLCTGYPGQLLAQSGAQPIQQMATCSVINLANGTANVNCAGVDPKLAEQMRAILNSSRRSEGTAKEISEKLDRLIAGLGAASFGNLKQRCTDMAIAVSNYASQREDLLKEFPMIRSSNDFYKNWEEGNSEHFYPYLPELERLQKDLAQHNIVDLDFDGALRQVQAWADVDGKYPEAHNRYLTQTGYIRGIAAVLNKIAGEIPQ